jgi:hypothetical protein
MLSILVVAVRADVAVCGEHLAAGCRAGANPLGRLQHNVRTWFLDRARTPERTGFGINCGVISAVNGGRISIRVGDLRRDRHRRTGSKPGAQAQARSKITAFVGLPPPW